MSNRADETWHRLREWTYGQAPSERLAVQILLSENFTDLDPSHPLGGKDGKKDALCNKDGLRYLMAVYFPRGKKRFTSIQKKFKEDLAGVSSNNAQAIAFVTNQELTLGERSILGDAAKPIKVEIFHLERITAILDQPSMAGVRKQFLDIEFAPPKENIEDLITQMKQSALNDIAKFRGVMWPSYEIFLNLKRQGDSEKKTVSLNEIATFIFESKSVHLISPPGTGKTITLVQLAETILCIGQNTAVFIPLDEWASCNEPIFEFLVKRHSFVSFQPKHFMQLAELGHLVLILDGWNELDPDSRIRVENHITMLRREFPLLSIVLSSRRRILPVPEVSIEIEGLSETQQLELARKLRGIEGEKLLDQAWRVHGLRELITIPLYFNALLNSTQTEKLPQTKEEILNIFVKQHEKMPAKAQVLQKGLFGFHQEFLVGLAVEANSISRTTIPDKNARRAVGKVVKLLKDDYQLTNSLQPTTVLDVLVTTHSLVRSHSGVGSISFQHQQFQEWYASFEVENLMRQAFEKNVDSHNILKKKILNWPAWEESILFACERLSRDTNGAEIIATVILDTISIDPMLAAEMIYHSAQEVWPHISEKVVRFVKRWHKPGSVDRAVRFIITSGNPDFAEYVWPFIDSSDRQLYLHALSIAQRFRPSVLGHDKEKRLAELPEDIRCDVLSEIAQRSGFDGVELVAELAKNDKSAPVVVEILQSLQFRHADRHVSAILQTASDAVWQLIASKGYPDKFLDPLLNIRLAEIRQALITNETDPIRIISYLTEDGAVKVGADIRLTQLIQSPDFPIKNKHAVIAIAKAFKIYPQAVATAVLQRIVARLELPYRADELLENTTTIDDGPVVSVALDNATPESIARAAYTVLGPISVGRIMDELFVLDDKLHPNGKQLDEADTNKYHRLRGAIFTSRQVSFLTALCERSNTNQLNRIELMADLLARHGTNYENEPLVVGDDIKKQLTKMLEQWIGAMLALPDSNQHQFSKIVRSIERVPETQFVPAMQKMLEREIACQEHEHEGYFQSCNSEISYMLQYRKTFAAIGDVSVIALMNYYLPDLIFGFDAACVLVDIWNREHPPKRFTSRHDFSEVKEKRISLCDAQHSPATCDFAESIFATIRKLASSDKDPMTQQHAIRLARIGLRMPHGVKRTEIDMLLNLPQKFANKQALLTAAAMAGEILPVQILVEGLKELLEDAKKETWRLNENQGELMGWIELFPFSDQPMDVLEAIDSLPIEYRHTWRLHRLFSALGHSPHEQALTVLEAFVQRDPQITQKWEWLNALVELGTETSAQVMLNLLCEGRLVNDRDALSHWKLSGQLASLAQKFPLLREDMLHRYEQISAGQVKEILESALIELSDTQILLRIIRSDAANKQLHDYNFCKAIENIAIGKRPVSNWSGAFEQFSVPLVEFRKQLFDMVIANDAQSDLAEKCLIQIESLRDEHGRISDEPRHPDIFSGKPWPKEADETL